MNKRVNVRDFRFPHIDPHCTKTSVCAWVGAALRSPSLLDPGRTREKSVGRAPPRNELHRYGRRVRPDEPERKWNVLLPRRLGIKMVRGQQDGKTIGIPPPIARAPDPDLRSKSAGRAACAAARTAISRRAAASGPSLYAMRSAPPGRH